MTEVGSGAVIAWGPSLPLMTVNWSIQSRNASTLEARSCRGPQYIRISVCGPSRWSNNTQS